MYVCMYTKPTQNLIVKGPLFLLTRSNPNNNSSNIHNLDYKWILWL